MSYPEMEGLRRARLGGPQGSGLELLRCLLQERSGPAQHVAISEALRLGDKGGQVWEPSLGLRTSSQWGGRPREHGLPKPSGEQISCVGYASETSKSRTGAWPWDLALGESFGDLEGRCFHGAGRATGVGSGENGGEKLDTTRIGNSRGGLP